MPFRAGSANAALLRGKAYICGGIKFGNTVNNCYKYDFTTKVYTEVAPMPHGVNHAAHVSAGKRMFVMGGRDGGNVPAEGFDYFQTYDADLDSWSVQYGNPIPFQRGGMGAAVRINNKITIFGGETSEYNTEPFTSKKVYKYID